MVNDLLAVFLTPHRSRPVSLAACAGSLFVPGTLIVFLTRPELFFRLDIARFLLLVLTISVPLIALCYSLFYTALAMVYHTSLEAQKAAGMDVSAAADAEDLFQWPSLMAGAWLAMVIQFVTAVVAYERPIQLGATLIAVAKWLLGIWVLEMVIVSVIVARGSVAPHGVGDAER